MVIAENMQSYTLYYAVQGYADHSRTQVMTILRSRLNPISLSAIISLIYEHVNRKQRFRNPCPQKKVCGGGGERGVEKNSESFGNCAFVPASDRLFFSIVTNSSDEECRN